MDIEKLAKKVEWLDEERRKDKAEIAALQGRAKSLEAEAAQAKKQAKDTAGEMARLKAVMGKMDQMDEALDQQRKEVTRQLESFQKQTETRYQEMEKIRRLEIESVNTSVSEVRANLSRLLKLDDRVQAREEDGLRLSREIEKMSHLVEDVQRKEEERARRFRVIDEGRAKDAKRSTDLQGEVTALRKRLEEYRGSNDLTSDGLRRLENRLNELVAAESERREAWLAYQEKQSGTFLEREQAWKQWQSRFETITQQSKDLEERVQSLGTLERSVKRSKQDLESQTERLERRINEITEIQRLAEDRTSQDWVNFKAEDQKRWANYSLTQEEQRKEIDRAASKVQERVTALEDLTEELRDFVQQEYSQTQKLMASLLAVIRDWTAGSEQFSGLLR